MGDIGPGQREYEVEPIEIPATPEPVPVPVEPVRVPVGVPQ